MTGYRDSATSVVNDLPITVQTLMKWAKYGYPITTENGIERVKVDGIKKIGNRYAFNKSAIFNFIERMDEKQWHCTNEKLLTKEEKLCNQRIGHMTSNSRANDIKAQLMARFSERKGKQRQNDRLSVNV